MQEKITVRISKTGEVSYDVQGVRGAGCRDLTRAIDALSNRVLERKHTGEYGAAGVGQQVQGRNT